MPLTFEDVDVMFPHSDKFDQGEGNIRRGQSTYVVALDGSGDFSDIKDALNALPPSGGVIYIKEGTYNLTKVITLNKSNVQLIGTGRATVIKQLRASTNGISIATQDYILIKNIRFTGPGGASPIGIVMSGVTDSTVSECWFDGWGTNPGADIKISSGSARNNIFNNHHTSSILSIWVLNSDKNIIIGNNISGTAEGSGIILERASGTCDDNIVKGNIIFAVSNGIRLSGSCMRSIVNGNIVSESDTFGIFTSSTTEDIIITDNIVVNTGGGTDLSLAGTNLQIGHNKTS